MLSYARVSTGLLIDGWYLYQSPTARLVWLNAILQSMAHAGRLPPAEHLASAWHLPVDEVRAALKAYCEHVDMDGEPWLVVCDVGYFLPGWDRWQAPQSSTERSKAKRERDRATAALPAGAVPVAPLQQACCAPATPPLRDCNPSNSNRSRTSSSLTDCSTGAPTDAPPDAREAEPQLEPQLINEQDEGPVTETKAAVQAWVPGFWLKRGVVDADDTTMHLVLRGFQEANGYNENRARTKILVAFRYPEEEGVRRLSEWLLAAQAPIASTEAEATKVIKGAIAAYRSYVAKKHTKAINRGD